MDLPQRESSQDHPDPVPTHDGHAGVPQAHPQPSFSERLESGARRIVAAAGRERSATATSRSIVSRIALTLDQIDSLRSTHQRLRDSLRRQELRIDTDILRREPRPPVYLDPRLPERDMLRGRLMILAAEQRRLALIEDKELRGLHDRLRESVTQWTVLRGQN